MESKDTDAHGDNSGHSSDIEGDNTLKTPQSEKAGLERPSQAFVPPDGGLQAWLCVLGGFCVCVGRP